MLQVFTHQSALLHSSVVTLLFWNFVVRLAAAAAAVGQTLIQKNKTLWIVFYCSYLQHVEIFYCNWSNCFERIFFTKSAAKRIFDFPLQGREVVRSFEHQKNCCKLFNRKISLDSALILIDFSLYRWVFTFGRTMAFNFLPFEGHPHHLYSFVRAETNVKEKNKWGSLCVLAEWAHTRSEKNTNFWREKIEDANLLTRSFRRIIVERPRSHRDISVSVGTERSLWRVKLTRTNN